ncbi:hypothetical protein GA0004736_3673 [Curtobacterium sp. 9128]|uniref:hypothetical protein n=1 Tax=Curtobacterium sp. 9128 TaxID=1793722 RepID=UPI0007D71C43|nr:hypothetical protein [Curtobacterium sp. 9128]SBN64709.1 hypothetical protein GA0004736_3673 [Curtobacterium sp. 9128]
MESFASITPTKSAIVAAVIKKLFDGLGGVAKAVQLFWGASFKWEKIQALVGAAAALGAELLGIAAVKQRCFS